jgi:hypothetical protein
VLAGGALSLLRWPEVTMFGLGPWRLFDVGGAVAAAALVLALIVSTVRTTRELYRAEPLTGGGRDEADAKAVTPSPTATPA